MTLYRTEQSCDVVQNLTCLAATRLALIAQAEDADVDKLRRDPRFAAAAAEAAAAGLPPPPERFHRLARPRFLALLASEVIRLWCGWSHAYTCRPMRAVGRYGPLPGLEVGL